MPIVAGAVARGLRVKANFLFCCFFCPCWGEVGWGGVGLGNNVHVPLLSDVMLR